MAQKKLTQIEKLERQRDKDIISLAGRLRRIDIYISSRHVLKQKALERKFYYVQVRQRAIETGRTHRTADRIIAVQDRKLRNYNLQEAQATADKRASREKLQKLQKEKASQVVRWVKRYSWSAPYVGHNKRDIEVALWLDAPRQSHELMGRFLEEFARIFLNSFYYSDYADNADFSTLIPASDPPTEERASSSMAMLMHFEYTDVKNPNNNRLTRTVSISSVDDGRIKAQQLGEEERER